MQEEQEQQEDVIIPQMVEDVRAGKMSRRRLITALSALGLSAGGIGAIVAVTSQRQSSKAIPNVHQNDNTQHHIQLHDQHITHQSQGDTGALHEDYANHAIVEDSMYLEPLIGRKAIMERKGMGMAAIPDLQITITNRVAHGNQVSAEWVATGTHNGDLPNMPATGRPFTLRGVTVTIREHGKIVRESIYYDLHDLKRQIGPGTPM
ncbi:MAG TPA: ester cyclase [Ktedonobacteraceae bacterium]|nr:ester cyclase [Ktedonobacteraceae bacterium]